MESSFFNMPTVRVYNWGSDSKKEEGKPFPVNVQLGFYHSAGSVIHPVITLIPPIITSLNERQVEMVKADIPVLTASLGKTQNAIQLVTTPNPHLEVEHLLRGDSSYYSLAVMDGPNQTKCAFRVFKSNLTCTIPDAEAYLFNAWV